MKKLLWMLTIALMAFGMVSCEKEKDHYQAPKTMDEAQYELDRWGDLASGIYDWLLNEKNEPKKAAEIKATVHEAVAMVDSDDALLKDYCKAIDLLRSACKPYVKGYFGNMKQMFIDGVEKDLLQDGDSDACWEIARAAQEAMRQVKWKNSRSYMQVFDLWDELLAINDKAREDLEEQRKSEGGDEEW